MLSQFHGALGEEKDAKFGDGRSEGGGGEVEREGLIDGPWRLGEGAEEKGEGIALGFGELGLVGSIGRGGEVEPDLVRAQPRRFRGGEEVGGEEGREGREPVQQGESEARRGAPKKRGKEERHWL